MLTITSEAAQAVREIRESNDLPDSAGLRITAEQEGDDVSIDLDFTEAPEAGDAIVEEAGARVFLDGQAAELLSGVELGVEAHGDHVHFQLLERGGED